MARPTSLIKQARGFGHDWPRDRMPEGYLWDMADFVPQLLDTQLTGRGGWVYVSDASDGDIIAGIQAPFKTGERALVVSSTGRVSQVAPGGALTTVGTVSPPVQNPTILADRVTFLSGSGAAPSVATATASAVTIAPLPGSPPAAKYGAVYKGRLMVANFPGHEERVHFSPPLLDPAKTWDVNSWYDSSQPITALGALRSVVLLFHAGSVERLRGSKPPDTAAAEVGDFILESLFDAAGCGDSRSVAYWNDNCIFADERGVHLTDGAIVRNLISQGGLTTFWRALYNAKATLAAETYLDYYVITIIRTDGISFTLICDLNQRAWFRFTNVNALSYIRSVGIQETLWGGRKGTSRLMSLSPCFFPPTPTNPTLDGDGAPVLPLFETPWYRLAEEGRKRVRFAYASYDVRETGARAMQWREGIEVPEHLPEVINGVEARAAGDPILEFSFITSPQEAVYQPMGALPPTSEYTRYRLPIGRHPYGLALRCRQVAPSSVTRVFDIALQAEQEERSRL